MPRGYWRVVFAVIGCLTLANSQPKDDGRSAERSAKAEIAQAAPSATRSPSVHPVYTSEYKAPCAEPENHDRCDLEAQWKAADAARDAADWAWWQMLFSAAGILGLIYSLILTRRATKVAVDATQDAGRAIEIAERNADAAVKLAEITERSIQMQSTISSIDLRPWIGFVGFDMKPFSGFVADGPAEDGGVDVEYGQLIEIHWANFGKTPAIRAGYSRQAEMIDRDDDSIPNFIEPSSQEGYDIVPPGRPTQAHPFCLHSDDLKAFESGERDLILYCVARYSSPLSPETRWTTEVCYRLSTNGEVCRGDKRLGARIQVTQIASRNTMT